MATISELSDELLVKILSFLPTKVAVSTSVLSKQWEFLWMWLPKLAYDEYHDVTDIVDDHVSKCLRYRNFIYKNMPLHRAPIIESLRLRLSVGSLSLQPEDFKSWVGIAVSRCVSELSIRCSYHSYTEPVLLPSSLYTCKSLVTLKLEGNKILVDVPRIVCLPSLKTLHLECVIYVNDDSLRLLLSYCPVLEDLSIERDEYDNVRALVVIVPSLQRLSLCIDGQCSSDVYVIVTPSLKYFKVEDHRESFSYLIEHMPVLEEADISMMQNPEVLLESVTYVKRLSVRVMWNTAQETVYRDGIVFNQLEKLKLFICSDDWSKLLVQLLKDSPKLQVLSLFVDSDSSFWEYEPVHWSNNPSSVPKCLLKSLETFEFAGYKGRPEERDFLSFIFKHARCLKSTSMSREIES